MKKIKKVLTTVFAGVMLATCAFGCGGKNDDKKSIFIASIARTNSVEEANAFIQEISKKYRDATHNTFAYTIGLNDEQYTQMSLCKFHDIK